MTKFEVQSLNRKIEIEADLVTEEMEMLIFRRALPGDGKSEQGVETVAMFCAWDY